MQANSVALAIDIQSSETLYVGRETGAVFKTSDQPAFPGVLHHPEATPSSVARSYQTAHALSANRRVNDPG